MLDKGPYWQPLQESNFADPYPMYQALRENDPVHKAQTGEWVVTRFLDVTEVLRDKRFLAGHRQTWLERGVDHLKNRGMDFQAIIEAMSTFILNMNPPEHTRVRQFISEAWVNRELEATVRNNVNALLENIAESEFDIVERYSTMLPTRTACDILGINVASHQEMKELGSAMIKALDPYTTLKDFVRINKASKDFIEFFTQQVHHKISNPENDLISSLIARNEELDGKLTTSELVSICIFMFVAGEETTASLIGTSIFNLLQNPSQLALAKSGGVNMSIVLSELLRFDSPVHLIGRMADADMELAGKAISKGEIVTLCLASANRDESMFENADRLDFNREQKRHLAFGYGIHYCLGDWLAKLQAQIALEEVLRKFPNLSLSDQKIEWRPMLAVRGLKRLVVRAND